MANKLERDENAMGVASGYSMDLYCCVKGCNTQYQIGGYDGRYCYDQTRKAARKLGWILHKDGFATCPNHKAGTKSINQ